MALEDALAANTAALERLTAALAGKMGGGTSAADAAINAEASRAAAAKANTKAAGAKVTIDTVKERFGAFLGAEDPKLRKTRIDQVSAMMQHYGVDRASALPPEQWAEAIGYLDMLLAGQTPNYMNESASEGAALI